jgi:hypothetical protein
MKIFFIYHPFLHTLRSINNKMTIVNKKIRIIVFFLVPKNIWGVTETGG